jgi:hypothetical protein
MPTRGDLFSLLGAGDPPLLTPGKAYEKAFRELKEHHEHALSEVPF